MQPARQIRLTASRLALIVAVLVASTGLVLGQGSGVADPFGGRPAHAPRPATPKRPAEKVPDLHASAEWTRDLPAAPVEQPAYDSTKAYVPLASGEIAALGLVDGAVTWKATVLPIGNVSAGDGLVFVPVAGAIEAYDAGTGAARWRAPFEGRLSAPLAWQNGWLFVATDRAGAIMLRASTGERLWHQALPASIRTRPAFTGDRLYVGLDDGHVLALNLMTGARIWSRGLGGRPTALAPLDDRVFAGADDKFLYCLSAKNGKADWRWRTGGAIVGTPIFDEENVYFLSLDNVLRALDRGNGHQVWHTGLSFRPLAGPYLAAGRLLVAGLMELRAFRAADGSEAGGAEISGELAAPPHLLPADEEGEQAFIVFTRDGQMVRMTPSTPPLQSKPFPATMIYPLWPLSEDGK